MTYIPTLLTQYTIYINTFAANQYEYRTV